MVQMKKESVEYTLKQIGDSLGELVSTMNEDDLNRTVKMIFQEGGFTKKEDELIQKMCSEGETPESISNSLLLLGEGSKSSAMIRIRMLMLGINENIPEGVEV